MLSLVSGAAEDSVRKAANASSGLGLLRMLSQKRTPKPSAVRDVTIP